MCPDQQILSIYIDGELPSPWKEKLETHLKSCSGCKEKYDNFVRLHNVLIEDTNNKKQIFTEEALEAKDKIWQKLASRRWQSKSGANLLRRRLSIPIPAAAAAAVFIAFVTAVWFDQSSNTSGFVYQQPEAFERSGFFIAADEEMPDVFPAADFNSVLQYLTSDSTDIIILRLPESRSFYRTGEPEIIRAADYQRRHP